MNKEIGDVVKIIDDGKVYPTINDGPLLLWPTEDIKKRGGRSGWEDWKPRKGDVGKIIHSTSLCQRTILILEIGKYIVPIEDTGVRYTTKQFNQKETETMSTPKSIKVESVLYIVINGERCEAKYVKDHQVFNYIQQLENEIEGLNKIKKQPTTLKAEISRLEGEIDALVEFVDNRAESK